MSDRSQELALAVHVFTGRRESLLARILRAVLGVWAGFSDWTDGDLVAANAARSVSLFESGIRQYGRQVEVFQRRALSIVEADVSGLPSFEAVYPRRNVSPFRVFERPVERAREALFAGGDPWEAFEERLAEIVRLDLLAVERDVVNSIADWMVEHDRAVELSVQDHFTSGDPFTVVDDEFTELELSWFNADSDSDRDGDSEVAVVAERDREAMVREFGDRLIAGMESREVVEAKREPERSGNRVIGWRRVLRPELSEHGCCGLCVVAASRFYTRQNLNALHDRCKCVVLPFTAAHDPGLVLNQEDLARLYEFNGGSTSGDGLKRLRVELTEHGELGQLLSYSAKEGWRDRALAGEYKRKRKSVLDAHGVPVRSVRDFDEELRGLEAARGALLMFPEENRSAIAGLDRAIGEVKRRRAA